MWAGNISSAAASIHKRAGAGGGAHLGQGVRHPYGYWESPVTPEWLETLEACNTIEDLFVDRVTGSAYYSERRGGEDGKNVVRDLETHDVLFECPMSRHQETWSLDSVQVIIPPPDVEGEQVYWDAPRFSPDGQHLVLRLKWKSQFASEAWVWQTQVHETSEGHSLAFSNASRVILGDPRVSSVSRPYWVNPSTLLISTDALGHIVPWIFHIQDNAARPLVSPDFADGLVDPHACPLDGDHVLYAGFCKGRTQFHVLKISDGAYHKISTPYSFALRLRSISPGKVIFMGSTETSPMAVVEMTVDTRDVLGTLSFVEIGTSQRSASLPTIPARSISTPTSFELEHPRRPETIHATLYPPVNCRYSGGLPDELPPVVVHIRGGPYRFHPQSLDWDIQAFTTRGFAYVSDVVRTAPGDLAASPVVADADACAAAVQALGARAFVDPTRAIIYGQGESAQMVFSALADPRRLFVAGVADLRSRITGGSADSASSSPQARSPVEMAESIASPLLMLLTPEPSSNTLTTEQAAAVAQTMQKNGRRAELHVIEPTPRARSVRETWETVLSFCTSVLV
ncbi:uncharacterized protein BXZ73DRAFT_80523 [Epithele typhae]|uniref:uncharacterized protein n=1 Tax=Epithele typhae TaxID=378194 RepID=UPI00200803A0|nr:uncharacterized protein BXZ73DRAFT_80523 [Epithele typhae]KAH9918754.1 hypothetical protein BXZ73DRAFT_80523 [Epithele typhae]